MKSTILGKRTRGSEAPAEECVQTRSKRRATLAPVNDENSVPSSSDEDEVVVARKIAPSHRTPSKIRSIASPRRVLPSPNTINSHFSVSKGVSDCREEKENIKTTPQTERHYDALSQKTPATPKHRVQILNSARSPQTPSTPSSASSNVYNAARQIFSRCSNPGSLVGRDEERKALSGFITQHTAANTGGCLYVSGPPGTGKSALIANICQEYQGQEHTSLATVNCMSVKNSKELASTLIESLSITGRGTDVDQLRLYFSGSCKTARLCLVVLDEVDHLVDLDLNLLYNLFEWSIQPSSNLILIGIANALDLTDRLLPRLKSRNLKPNLLPFMPYDAAQIAGIITSKLKSLNEASSTQDFIPFLHPAAIQFCSKKVAAQTGDIRKAFDICRRAVDLIEQETKAEQARLTLLESPSKTPLMENINLASPPVQRSPSKTTRQLKLASSLAHLTTGTAPRATIAHMAKVTSLAFSNGTTQRLQSLNIQQKAVLCALVATEKKKRESASNTVFATPSKGQNAAPTIKQLFDSYSSICKHDNLLHPLTSVEFRDVVGGLETLSLISAMEGKNGSFAMPITPSKTPSRRSRASFAGAAAGSDERRMGSSVGYQELWNSLHGPGSDILKDIMEGRGL